MYLSALVHTTCQLFAFAHAIKDLTVCMPKSVFIQITVQVHSFTHPVPQATLFTNLCFLLWGFQLIQMGWKLWLALITMHECVCCCVRQGAGAI